MKFGTLVAKALEDDEFTGDPVLDMILTRIPKFEIMDKPHECTMKIGKKIVPLLARMDSRRENFRGFKEYKTGKDPWTQAKVDKDPQVTFYATYCYIVTGEIPDDMELVWVPTENDPDDPKKVRVTGEMIVFKTTRSKADIIKEKADMLKVWEEIGIACEKELL